MTYKVYCNLLLLPQFVDGVTSGINRECREGDIITDADLVGVDVDRLLSLGSIVVASEDEVQSNATSKLDAMTKKELEDFADSIGLDVDPKKMNKAEMIEAILARQSELSATGEQE